MQRVSVQGVGSCYRGRMANPMSANVLSGATPLAGGNVGELFVLRDASRVLKMLRNCNEDAAARFRVEMDLQAQIDSAFVPKVFERGEIDGRPFFVMERRDGKTVESVLLEEAPLNAFELGVGLLRAVSSVHAAGVTHRDLKSDNVLIGPSGVSVLDFGAASLTRAEGRTALQFGSSICWGPERLRGSDGADVRSDLFAVGLLLYMVLAGVHPFAYGTSKWKELLSSKAPSLRAFRPQRTSFDGFFGTALAPEISARFSSAMGMEDAWRDACTRAHLA